MTNDYQTLENDIVARLAPLVLQGVDVEPFPDIPADFEKPFERPRITVMYKSSDFDEAQVKGLPTALSTAEAVQDEFVDVEIVFRARTKRGQNGIYDLMRKTRLLLFGFQPTHFGKLYLKDNTFVQHDVENGVWMHSSTMTCQGKAVQAFCDDDTIGLPLLNLVNTPINE